MVKTIAELRDALESYNGLCLVHILGKDGEPVPITHILLADDGDILLFHEDEARTPE